MTGTRAAEILTSNIDMTMDCLEFGEALACWDRLQKWMERKRLEIETLSDAEVSDPGPKPRNKQREQELARAVQQSVVRCGPVNDYGLASQSAPEMSGQNAVEGKE